MKSQGILFQTKSGHPDIRETLVTSYLADLNII